MKYLLLSGVLIINLSVFSQFNDTNTLISKLKVDLKEKHDSFNNIKLDTGNFAVYYSPIIVNKICGIYSYGIIGSHHSRKNLFLIYLNDITILNTENEIDLENNLKTFLIKNQFKKRERKECLREIKKIMNAFEEDSF